jgi:hypothetical protein
VVVEFLVFVVFCYIFYGVWLARHLLNRWRTRRREATLVRLVASFAGKPVSEAQRALGPPVEILDGPSGRRLYVWRPPASRAIPPAPGVVVVTTTVEADGTVAETSWRTI